MSESQDKPFQAPKNILDLIGGASAEITFKNMTKLCNQDVYEVAGEKYKRKILKPKELAQFYKLQQEADKITDPLKRMDNIFQQAQVCLEGITREKFDKTDIVKLEIIIGACFLITKGFREV